MALCEDYKIPHSAFLDWDPEDRAKALAYRAEKSERCVMCGTAQWEWEENPHAYIVEDVHCPGCYRKHRANEEKGRLPGTSVQLVKPTPARLARLQIMEEKRQRIAAKDAAERAKAKGKK